MVNNEFYRPINMDLFWWLVCTQKLFEIKLLSERGHRKIIIKNRTFIFPGLRLCNRIVIRHGFQKKCIKPKQPPPRMRVLKRLQSPMGPKGKAKNQNFDYVLIMVKMVKISFSELKTMKLSNEPPWHLNLIWQISFVLLTITFRFSGSFSTDSCLIQL